ncbi:translation initiation factor IF-2 [Eggerthella lenta]|uniref:Translation initiation factor IF-2 n=1 Tax=Eggerthella lenta TaxID=84112 RepID=A0A5C5BPP1_EGGLN|nr:translation initiation factor IF-2 [Eggerthella lenta]MDB1768922.1 translation initiation factor IF-2 [Eggerthella lenta]MDU5351869.1 translation initiation factor IF-2 [Eggerthella sp.]TNU88506.1 translation initiation factor IF-2 [Eggerthella lenta]
MGLVLAIIVSVACIVYGAFLFAGNEFCYRLLAGGDSFLALNPSDAALRKSARQSAVAVWMVVVVLWCTLAHAYAQAGEPFDTAFLVIGAAAGVVVAVIVVSQIKQYADVLKEHHG